MKNLLAAFAAPLAHGLRMVANLVILKLIAITLGPIGMGTLGNFMSLTTMISVFAGAGITTGITKYVAEYKSSPKRLIRFLGSSFTFGFIFSTFFLTGSLIFSSQISIALFDTKDLYWLIITAGVAQLFCFFGSAVIAVANGLQRQDVFAIISLAGYLFAIPISFFLIKMGGVSTAAIALLLVAGAAGLPALYFSIRSPLFKIVRLKLIISDAKLLFRYSIMAFVSALTFPTVEIIIRTLIIEFQDHNSAGLWQAMTRLSGAYLGLFTLYLSTNYMPQLSAIYDRTRTVQVVSFTLIKIAILFSGFAFIIYFLRDYIISNLYSVEFLDISNIIIWYLIGDLFRITSYVIGFIGVAKGALRIYIVCELLQALLLIAISYVALRQNGSLLEIAQAYTFSYLIYALVSLIIFKQYKRGSYDFSR